jgi:signal transduction histidine kinase
MKFPQRLIPKTLRSLSLPTIFIVPFVIQIVGMVGLASYFAIRNDRESVSNYVAQLTNQASNQVEQHLNDSLAVAQKINRINAEAIESGMLDVKDFEQAGHYFWKQVSIFGVSYVGYALTTGEFAGAGKFPGKPILILDERSARTGGKFYSYEADKRGNRTKLVQVADYDPLADEWYAQAARSGKPIWSDVYSAEGFADYVAISASYPFYNRDRQLQGVINVDLLLSDLGKFLREIEISPSAKVFIIERDGELVATSGSEKPFVVVNGESQRVKANESSDRSLQDATRHLLEQFGSFDRVKTSQLLIFKDREQKHFVRVTPYKDPLGLDWLIVTTVPESDFSEDILADAWIGLVMCAIAAIIAISIGILTARWVTKPITRLNQAARELASGNLDYQVKSERTDELGDLARSFDTMAAQLRDSFNELRSLNLALCESQQQLAASNQTLELQVAKRTEELSQTLERLKTAQAEIVHSEKMAALGQLVAGIAHEINTPLGAIRASIGNISSTLMLSLQELPQLFRQLSSEQLDDFFRLLDLARQAKEPISFREERQLKRALKKALADKGYESADVLSELLSKMGIATESLDTLAPLLQASNKLFIFESAYHLSAIQNNSDNIQLAIERAAKIVFALKNFARQDNYSSAIAASVIDGIETVLTLYHNQIKRGIEVSKSYAEVPPLLCYPDELTQVWSNLISNAIAAMNEQGTLSIEVFERDKGIVVEIADSGSGIPQEIQAKIFEPFFTTKPMGEGSGLGLDIVRKIVEKHRGKVTVSSQPGHTKFSVWLPTQE